MARPGLGDGPFPKFRRHHVRHVAAKSIHAQRLPMFEHAIHFVPRVGNDFLRRIRVRIFTPAFCRVGEIESVIEFGGFVPVVYRWRPTDHVVSGDAAEFHFAAEKAVTSYFREFTGGADSLAVSPSW